MRIEPSPNRPLRPGRYAAIDIGTVTCRLLVAEVTPDGAVEDVQREMAICNLGEGVDETHRLSPQAIERVGAAVDGFAAEIARWSALDGIPVPTYAVATSATRDAENADEFRARLETAGVVLHVIPGEKEAAFSFAGASAAFPAQPVAVVDVGGGSTEVIAGTGGGAPAFARSFDVGCRRLTERFLHADPPAPEQLAEGRAWLHAQMDAYLDELAEAGCFAAPFVAVAGTATSCVTMRDRVREYDPALVHGAFVSGADVEALLQRLAVLPLAQRREVVGLEPRRAEVIVAGLLVLQAIIERTGAPGFIVSELDILHGIVLAMASEADILQP